MEGMVVDGASDDLQVTEAACQDRLERRIAALERQLEARIAQIDEYQRRLAQAEGVARAAERAMGDVPQVVWKAAEYDALMNTATMKALRLPRSWYARARRAARRARGS